MQLQIKELYFDVLTPTRAYSTDSGLDLYAYLFDLPNQELNILPGERKLVGTGISIKLPEPTEEFIYEAQVRSKSGLTLKQGLVVLNSPGTIDSSYTGEICVILYNASNKTITIKHHQKIAQLVVCPIVIPRVTIVKDFEVGERASNGFGSTGI
jgi:dUTP pyrophosphatase